MRDIKFKGVVREDYRTENVYREQYTKYGEWYTGAYVKDNEQNSRIITEFYPYDECESAPVYEDSVSQFVGEFDKVGNEIYENDTVMNNDCHTGVVIYGNWLRYVDEFEVNCTGPHVHWVMERNGRHVEYDTPLIGDHLIVTGNIKDSR